MDCGNMMTSSNGKKIPRYWPFVRGIHRSPVNSSHKSQWRGALMLSLIYAWINGWVNNREAGDLRRHRAHCDVIVMISRVLGGVKFYLGGKNKVQKNPIYVTSMTKCLCIDIGSLIYAYNWQINICTTFANVWYFFCHPQKQYYPHREWISLKQGYGCNKAALLGMQGVKGLNLINDVESNFIITLH